MMAVLLLFFLSPSPLRLSEALATSPAWHGSAKNLRPVVPGVLYRCGSLDSLSVEDARALLSGEALGGGSMRPLSAVIDLRNDDEIEKGEAEWTEGSELFYSSSSSSSSSSS